MKIFLAVIFLFVTHMAVFAAGLRVNIDTTRALAHDAVVVQMWTACETHHKVAFNGVRYWCAPRIDS